MECKNCGIEMKLYKINQKCEDSCSHTFEVSDAIRQIVVGSQLRPISELVTELREVVNTLKNKYQTKSDLDKLRDSLSSHDFDK